HPPSHPDEGGAGQRPAGGAQTRVGDDTVEEDEAGTGLGDERPDALLEVRLPAVGGVDLTQPAGVTSLRQPPALAARAVLGAHPTQLREATGGDGRPDRRQGTREGERSEEHTSELQSRFDLVCRLLLEKKNK